MLRHVLILILDWTANGARSATAVPQMRQFTPWARHLGGFLEHHGVRGFLANADATTTPSGKPLTPKSFGRKLAGQVDRWHTDVVLRSEVDSNCETYWVVRNDS